LFPLHPSQTLAPTGNRVHNGEDLDGGPAGIGIQARDRLIRKLIEKVRRLRQALR